MKVIYPFWSNELLEMSYIVCDRRCVFIYSDRTIPKHIHIMELK